jgi:hypothetical protein
MRMSLVLATLVLSAPLLAGEKSGLDKGSPVNPFDVLDVTGPNASKTLCYRWQYGARPVVLIVANEVDEHLTGLVKKIDAFVKENKKANAAAFVVLMQKDSEESKAKLKKIAKDNKLEIPLTIAADPNIPDKLKLNSKVKNTVLIWKKQKVADAFALNEVTDKDIEAVLKAAKEAVSSS